VASGQALAHGFGRGYLVAAAVMVLAAVIAVTVIRTTKADLAGADPASPH
jgi:hypothetical protein